MIKQAQNYQPQNELRNVECIKTIGPEQKGETRNKSKTGREKEVGAGPEEPNEWE